MAVMKLEVKMKSKGYEELVDFWNWVRERNIFEEDAPDIHDTGNWWKDCLHYAWHRGDNLMTWNASDTWFEISKP